MENFQLVWLDPNLDASTSPLNARYYRSSILKLNTAARFFTDSLKCLDFMKTIKKEKLILVLWGSVANMVLKNIHSYESLAAVFIFF